MLKLPLVTVAASSFPAQEQRWLEAAAAGRSLPREPEANCADCTMCKPHSEPLTSIDVLFDDRPADKSKYQALKCLLPSFPVTRACANALPRAAA